MKMGLTDLTSPVDINLSPYNYCHRCICCGHLWFPSDYGGSYRCKNLCGLKIGAKGIRLEHGSRALSSYTYWSRGTFHLWQFLFVPEDAGEPRGVGAGAPGKNIPRTDSFH